ncbi:MAG: 7TM diverse intracellular signaling domain-containing protein, partial [Bacteroidota bacterium]
MTIGKLSFLVLFLMFSYTERERVFINDETEEFILTIQEIPILVDSAGTLDFEQVLSQPREFNIHPQFKPQDYCISCVYWIKIPLLVGKSTKKQWMLEFYDQTIDQITAYFPQEDGSYSSEAVGDLFPFHEKGFMHKNFEWLLDTDITGHQDIYFRIESHTYADVRIAVRTVNRFIYYSLNEYFLYGLFYGMIFIITVYNLLMFSAIRERKYLFYTFYILSVGIYAMCVDGIAYQYLWPNSPEWNQIAYGTARFSLIFWSLLFARRFLNTATRAPRLDVLFKIVILSRVLFFLYTFWLDHDLFEFTSVEILPLTLIFYSSIHVLLRGYQPARFFVVAFGFLFLGFLIKALLHLSVIPFVILSYYSLHICFLFEMLFLTFALSDRVRILKANRDRALNRIIIQHQENAKLKDKVNKELEEKIKQRTKELEQKNLQLAETNQRLYEQTNEINRINSTLDIDNWKLKNSLKDILQDRWIIINRTLEQFQQVFAD